MPTGGDCGVRRPPTGGPRPAGPPGYARPVALLRRETRRPRSAARSLSRHPDGGADRGRAGADRAERLLAELNPPQREAVTPRRGPAAGARRAPAPARPACSPTGSPTCSPPAQARPDEILAITFTNKAARRCASGSSELVGRSVRAMWVMTFHSACARMLRIEAERLGYSRSFTIYDESDSLRMLKRCMAELGVDTKRYPPRAIRAQISGAKNQLVDAGAYAEAQGSVFEEIVGRGLRALREADARSQRDGLRRPAGPHRQRAGALRGGPRALAAHLPPRPRRRVPGHQPRPVPAAAAARRRARQPDGRRRRQPVDLRLPPRRHPQHPRLRARLPRGRGGEARAELPLDPDDPLGRQRGDRAQPRTARRRSSGPRSPAARRCSSPSSTTSTRRRATSPARSRGSSGRRACSATTSRSSTGPTRRAGCWRTSWSATSSPTR